MKQEIDDRDDLTLELFLRPSTTTHYEASSSVAQPPLPLPLPPSPPSSQLILPLFFQNPWQMHIQSPDCHNPIALRDSNTRSSRSFRPSRCQQNSKSASSSSSSSGITKSETITPPFPWATDRPATVHRLDYLQSNQILKITGDVQCRRCEAKYEIEYDLTSKFYEIANFIVEQRDVLHDRAPSIWSNPILPTCKFCGQENSAKPILAGKKRFINWLFLFLGQMLGCCTLEQLRYFCKYSNVHRTGVKDRILYLTYMAMCKQLDPLGPFCL